MICGMIALGVALHASSRAPLEYSLALEETAGGLSWEKIAITDAPARRPCQGIGKVVFWVRVLP